MTTTKRQVGMPLRGERVEAQPARLAFAGLMLDLDGHSLTDASGAGVPLTPSEFALLATFLRGAGRALSRDHLLQSVSGRMPN